MTAVASGAWIAFGSWANSGCFLRMCCTIFVCREKQRSIGRMVSKEDLLRAMWNPTAWPNTAFRFPSVKQHQDSHYEIFWAAKLNTRITNLLLIRADTEVLSSTAFYSSIKCFMTFSKGHLFCVLFPCSSSLQLPESSLQGLPFMIMLWQLFSTNPLFMDFLALKQADCTCTVSTQHKISTLRRRELCLWTDRWQRPWWKSIPRERLPEARTSHTLLLYCLEQWGQHTGGVAIVPVSWVWVLSMGSGSPGPAGRSFRMLGGSSAPGWFFRMCALRLLALLYTCRAKIWN